MIHPLDGARLKVIRAQEHLHALQAEISMYLEDDMHTVVSQKQHHHVGAVIRTTGSISIGSEPPLRLSAIVGDVVVNARAALDYITWELITRFFSPPFNVKSANDRRITAFPILVFGGEKGYADRLVCLAKRLKPANGIDIATEAVQAIRDSQTHGQVVDPLGWLHQLVNTDKHRMPLLMTARFNSATLIVDRGTARMVISSFGDGDVGVKGVRGQGDVFGSGIVEMTNANIDTDRVTYRTSAMNARAQVTTHIAFKDVSMPREPVDRTLDQIIKTVADVLPRFEKFF